MMRSQGAFRATASSTRDAPNASWPARARACTSKRNSDGSSSTTSSLAILPLPLEPLVLGLQQGDREDVPHIGLHVVPLFDERGFQLLESGFDLRPDLLAAAGPRPADAGDRH